MALTVTSNVRVATAPDANGTVFLVPRPLARQASSFVLLPLLPTPSAARPLPAELWARVFVHLLADGGSQWRSLVTVSRGFKVRSSAHLAFGASALTRHDLIQEMLAPLVYERVQLASERALAAFTALLHAADQRWDSIRRIPYSVPGRWVKTLDLSHPIPSASAASLAGAHAVDALLAHVLPLLPFLEHLALDPAQGVPSRRVLAALTGRDGAERLRVLTGLALAEPSSSDTAKPGDDLVVALLRRTPHLEELGLVGPGLDALDGDESEEPAEAPPVPLRLPRLHTLSAVSIPNGVVLHALLHAPLPALRALTLTPYEGAPGALTSSFIGVHGASLVSLSLVAPAPSWPTVLHSSPSSLLVTCPCLTSLSLCKPLPALTLPSPNTPHTLRTLALPRPSPEVLPAILDAVRLPALRTVRLRDVRWLRAGIAGGAREAGVQGEMRDWRTRLSRRGILLLDAEGSDALVLGSRGGRG